MRLTCPSCAAGYDVPDDAIGPAGRKVRCRACGTQWHEPSRAAAPAPGPVVPLVEPAPTPAPAIVETPPARAGWRRWRGAGIALGLAILVLLLGAAVALIVFGPKQVATGLGLAERRVPLGIAITRQPDWRMIAGGSELFAVTGRVWNPTTATEPVPDIRAELKDPAGRTVYAWTIARPASTLAPGRSVDFDGAAVDVPRSSSRVVVSFVGTGEG